MKERYYQQYADCGKPTCRTCREGKGHGPYWYSYRIENGQTKRRYVGKSLPPGVAPAILQSGQMASVDQEVFQEDQRVRLFVLGSLRLERRTDPQSPWMPVTDAGLRHRVIRGLLACLVSAESRQLSREQAMEGLWPESDPETAPDLLDRAMYNLRRLLEPERASRMPSLLVQIISDQIVLADQASLWCDADAFVVWLAQARRAGERGDPGSAELLLEKAVALYRGSYLAGCLKNCLLGEELHTLALMQREKLRRQWIGALLELADRRIERLDYKAALEPLDRILSVDSTNEAAVGRLMRVLFWLDRRDEALRAYRGLSRALKQSYQTTPLKKVSLLSNSIRAGEWKSHDAVQDQAGLGRGQQKLVEGRSGQFVGREQETEYISCWMTTLEHLAQLRLRGGTKPALITDPDAPHLERCLLLMGARGIGKTRLALEAASLARARGWLAIEVRAYAQERQVAYGLWTRLLRKILMQARVSQDDLSSRPLMMYSLKMLLPELSSPSVMFRSPLAPEQEQLRLWEAICKLLVLVAQSTPLFLVLDNLQFADEKSCELLSYIVRRWLGILIIGTCRREELPSSHSLSAWLSEVEQQQHVKMLQMAPLSMHATCTLVSQRYPELPEPAIQAISLRAAGNPYFAEELARALSASCEQVSDNPTRLIQELDGLLPDSIVDIFKRSLYRLGKENQHLLAKAAVFGTSFTFEQLYALEAQTSKASEVFLLRALEEACQAGLLIERQRGAEITYYFWHPLLVKYLIRGISAGSRAQLRRHIAAILSSPADSY